MALSEAQQRVEKAVRRAESELDDAEMAVNEALSAVRQIRDSTGLPDRDFLADLSSLIDDVERGSVLAPTSVMELAQQVRDLMRQYQ